MKKVSLNTAWLMRLMAIALLFALSHFAQSDISQVVLTTIAGVFILQTALESRRISSLQLRSFVRMSVSELALLFLWLTFNLVRVYNYEAAVGGVDSIGRTAYWFAVSTQPYFVWTAVAVLIGFAALSMWRFQTMNGLNENNV